MVGAAVSSIGEGATAEIPELSQRGSGNKAAFNGKYKETDLNYGFIATGDSNVSRSLGGGTASNVSLQIYEQLWEAGGLFPALICLPRGFPSLLI